MTQSIQNNAGSETGPAYGNLPLEAAEVRRRFAEAAYVGQRGAGKESLSTPEVLARLGLVEERAGLDRRLAEQGDLERLASCPIIGVLGMLNAGKSSLVQSFLGAEGRRRVPVGINPSEGTQRFVFWLPVAWREGVVRGHLERLIEDNFGCPPEVLDDAPSEAHRQYNDMSRFKTPLIAFDEGLDARQVAFLDCPDIEREMPGEVNEGERGDAALVSEMRKQVLEQTAELCSAFVLVAELRKVESALFHNFLSSVRRIIPDLPLFPAINQAPGEFSAAAWGEAFRDRFKELGLDRIYLAYNFYDERSVKALPEDVVPIWISLKERKEDPLVFFTENPAPDAPRLLADMPATRGPGKWVGQRILSGWKGFAEDCEAAERAIETRNGEIEDRQKRACKAVQMAVETVLVKDGKVCMPIKVSAKLLGNAISETAPFYVRPFFKLRKRAAEFGKVSYNRIAIAYRAITGNLVPASKEEMEKTIKQKLFDEHGIRVEDLLKALRDNLYGLGVDEISVETGVRHAFERWGERFEAFTDAVDTAKLNAFMENGWRRMPFRQRAKVTLSIATATALTTIAPFAVVFGDGGLTAAAVAYGTGSILGGVLLAVFSTTPVDKYLRDTLGQRAASELTAYLLDAFGLPRKEIEGVVISAEKIKLDFAKADPPGPPVADLRLGQSYQRVDTGSILGDWIRGRLASGEDRS